MKNNVKNIIVIVCFIMITLGFMLANIITPDSKLSYKERRRLLQIPTYSSDQLFNGEIFQEFEEYSLDQFVFRDIFRGIKAFGAYYLLNQMDNNKVYIVDGNINKFEYPLNQKSILNATDKLNEIYNRYLKGMNVNYAIIPDKNYFIASQNGYLSMDYERLKEMMQQKLTDFNYIDLFETLTIEDYYHTDIHWSQDKIIDIADQLLKEMDNDIRASEFEYIKRELYPFYGAYYGQAALNVAPDTMVYLTNQLLEKAEVYDYEFKSYSQVYRTDKFEGMDPYDVFLSGAKPLITIINPEKSSNKELILFRDSFGSSIAPLLLSGYAKITLVDLRYITTDLVGEYIEFSKEQDVLFLYNTQILNNSWMLK